VVEFDAAKRKALFAQMQQIWAEELPSIPLRFRTNPFISRKGLLNYTANTYTGGFSGPFGFASWQAYLIGWESRGAQRIYDQAKFALSIK
jgi:peptide/nickel transport system substrate-binding protein